jgi:hypothetical protein
MGLPAHLRIEDHLDNPVTIPQFDKDQSPEIPSPLNPSQQDYVPVGILFTEIATIICSFQVSQEIDHHCRLIVV